jgi:hypothetical protein
MQLLIVPLAVFMAAPASSQRPFLSSLQATKDDPLFTTYAAAMERSEFTLDEGYHLTHYDTSRGIEFTTAIRRLSGFAADPGRARPEPSCASACRHGLLCDMVRYVRAVRGHRGKGDVRRGQLAWPCTNGAPTQVLQRWSRSDPFLQNRGRISMP